MLLTALTGFGESRIEFLTTFWGLLIPPAAETMDEQSMRVNSTQT